MRRKKKESDGVANTEESIAPGSEGDAKTKVKRYSNAEFNKLFEHTMNKLGLPPSQSDKHILAIDLVKPESGTSAYDADEMGLEGKEGIYQSVVLSRTLIARLENLVKLKFALVYVKSKLTFFEQLNVVEESLARKFAT